MLPLTLGCKLLLGIPLVLGINDIEGDADGLFDSDGDSDGASVAVAQSPVKPLHAQSAAATHTDATFTAKDRTF